MAAPSLVVIAGPNGSGKSSLIKKLATMPGIDLGIYINADDIELDLRDIADLQLRSREAQRIADGRRARCLDEGAPFSFETVMSHPSKIDLMNEARQRGFRVTLFFVAVDDPLLNVERVSVRVSQGGHSVPPDRIVSRYRRTLALLPQAILAADSVVLFDNTAQGSGPQAVASVTRGAGGFRLEVHQKGCEWLERELLAHLPFSGLRSGQVSFVLIPEAVLRDMDQRRTAELIFP